MFLYRPPAPPSLSQHTIHSPLNPFPIYIYIYCPNALHLPLAFVPNSSFTPSSLPHFSNNSIPLAACSTVTSGRSSALISSASFFAFELGSIAWRAAHTAKRCGALCGCAAAKASLYAVRSASGAGAVKVSARTVAVSVGREGDLLTAIC